MSHFYSSVFKPLLFSLDPETAHELTVSGLNLVASLPFFRVGLKSIFSPENNKDQSFQMAGLKFKNPVGMAAGFDKNAHLINALPLLGFGFAEIGTVTPRPQSGNQKPRLFRLPIDEAIINRMGFNNDGMVEIAKRLSRRKDPGFIIGGNIGKNKDTPNELAFEDYRSCFLCLNEFVDYFTINLSSPNTPGLRQLLEKESLGKILYTVQEENQKLNKPKPLFLKISPDMEEMAINQAVEICKELKIAGIVSNNTSIQRDGLKTNQEKINAIGPGGLSGRPIQSQSKNVLSGLKKLVGSDLFLMASGGIMSGPDAKERMDLGANAIQIYTGLIYRGPGLVPEILDYLAKSNTVN